MENIFDQSPYQCRMDWGEKGTIEASNRGDIIVIVDVLSFSTTITGAVHHGAIVYPFPKVGDIEEFGKLVDAEVCLGRVESQTAGLPSLSATSFNESHKDKRYVLSSRNGATCAKASKQDAYILIGSLLNISSIANIVNKIQKETNINITVIACGERWRSTNDESRELRPSIEDYLGAGAILEKLEGTKSPEAKVCIGAFQNAKPNLSELINDSSSGRELINMGYPEDVKFSCQVDLYKDVPILIKDEKGQSFFKNYID